MKRVIIIFIIVFLLSGCYNYKELNKLAIVSSVSIDKSNNEYLVGAQVINIKNKEDTSSSNVTVYEAKGKTIEEALRKMTMKSDKKLYGGHLNKLVISEDVAKDSIINIIDLFQRLPEIKDEFTITISKDIEANKVIKMITSSESIPADYVKNTIDSSDLQSALTYSSKLDEFVSYYLKDYIDPVISVIRVKNYNDNSTKTSNKETTYSNSKIVLDNIAITNNGKFEKYLNDNETIGYNFIKDNINQMIIPIKCGNNYSSISVLSSKTKNKVVKKDNYYVITFNIKSNATINEYNCKKDLDNEKTINFLERESERKIKKYINDVLDVKSKSEFLGLKRIIYLNYPQYKDEDYKIKTNIKVNISRNGDIRNSSKGEKHEYKN
ncbi:MAG: Ger(x)C family spore germination protein [Bacilli bacterium]|nr:Ger(x)C family spore germination protein [Bacilli bacterium]MBO6194787.1 Ger(x)C family spore germination protein [Bacilli bacterium]